MSCLSGGNGSGGSGNNGSAQKKQKLSSSPSNHMYQPQQQQQQYQSTQLGPYTRSSDGHIQHNNHGVGAPSGVYINGYAQHNGHIPNGYGPSNQSSSSGAGQSPSQQQQHQQHHHRVPSKSASPSNISCEYPLGNSVSCYDMCVYCFDVLINRLRPEEVPRVDTPSFPHANESFPLFVTWKSHPDGGGGGGERDHHRGSDGGGGASGTSKSVLRGCIGTFTDTRLHKGLHDYALSSALKDSRFAPIQQDEVPKLVVAVSVLLHFEGADHWDDWEIGVHGLRLEIETDRGQKKTATYLPEVASEQRWSKKQTIDSLLHKSGYSGKINSEVRNRIRLTRYKSEKVTLSYAQYRARKQATLRQQSLVLTNGVGGPSHSQSLVSPTCSAASSPMKALSLAPKAPSGGTSAGGIWGNSATYRRSSAGSSGGSNPGGSSPRRANRPPSLSDQHAL